MHNRTGQKNNTYEHYLVHAQQRLAFSGKIPFVAIPLSIDLLLMMERMLEKSDENIDIQLELLRLLKEQIDSHQQITPPLKEVCALHFQTQKSLLAKQFIPKSILDEMSFERMFPIFAEKKEMKLSSPVVQIAQSDIEDVLEKASKQLAAGTSSRQSKRIEQPMKSFSQPIPVAVLPNNIPADIVLIPIGKPKVMESGLLLESAKKAAVTPVSFSKVPATIFVGKKVEESEISAQKPSAKL